MIDTQRLILVIYQKNLPILLARQHRYRSAIILNYIPHHRHRHHHYRRRQH